MSNYIETEIKKMITNLNSGSYDREAAKEVNYGLRTMVLQMGIQHKERAAKAVHGDRLQLVKGLNDAPELELIGDTAPATPPSKTPKLTQAK